MSLTESFEFSLRSIFSQFDLVAWLWAVVVFLLSFVVAGLFWGMCWNRKWAYVGHWPSLAWSAISALCLATVVLEYRGATRAAAWIETQRDLVTSELIGLGSLNREIFRSAWDKLYPLGGQNGLAAPIEGGNELRLSRDDDARVLVEVASSAIKQPLLAKAPFSFGVPCQVRDSSAVADDVMKAISPPVYPVIVTPDNEWSKAAIKDQIATAFDSAVKEIRQPTEDLKTSLIGLGLVVFLIQFVLIPIAACRDIKENPKT
jgi:hypothetical protein